MLKHLMPALILIAFALGLTAYLSAKHIKPLDQIAYAASPKALEFLGGPSAWINTDGKALRLYGPQGVLLSDPYAPGKKTVVLVDFWEYTCVNCIRTFPYVKDWAARYRSSGLIVVGIHSPEFQFAHDQKNVAAAVKRFGISYPVLVDSDYKNWSDFGNQSWPNEYVLDPKGRIVYSHSGEGDYADTEQRLRDLLLAANPGETLPPAFGDHEAAMPDAGGMTGELYCGSDRGSLQNPEGFNTGRPTNYAPVAPGSLADGQFALSGAWQFSPEYVQHASSSPSDSVAVAYHARDCVMVIKPEIPQPFKAYVTQDGKPVARADAGADIHYEPGGRSYLLIDASREYQLTHNREFGAHTLALYPDNAQFRLYEIDFTAN